LKIIVDPGFSFIRGIYADLLLADNVISNCDRDYILRQTYSLNFFTSLDINTFSGNPGYIFGNNLLIASNNTINSETYLKENIYGFYTMGADKNGRCFPNDGIIKATDLDNKIRFGETMQYSCYVTLSYKDYVLDFCTSQKWKNYLITEFPKLIQYVGQFGNSNYKAIKVIELFTNKRIG